MFDGVLIKIIKKYHIDFLLRFVVNIFKSYRGCNYKYDICYYIDDLLSSSFLTKQEKEALVKNPKSCIDLKNDDGVCIKLGIKYWQENKYRLRKKTTHYFFYPLGTSVSSLYFVRHNRLYKLCGGKKKFLSYFEIDDIRYSEIVSLDHFFAIRTGNVIKISQNEKDWFVIYKGKRGIRKSMIIIRKNDKHALIFIEYTPGVTNDSHRIMQYIFETGELNVLKEFPNTRNKCTEKNGLYVRHIHLIQEDPFTGDIYVGTGDSDEESMILVSKDFGDTFKPLFAGSQLFRTLSFIFTKDFIFWTTDTHEPQYILRYARISGVISKYPLINGALWCTLDVFIEKVRMVVLSSNSEGALYDNNNRVYGIVFVNGEPKVYELLKSKSRMVYSQRFPLCVFSNVLYFYNSDLHVVEEYTLEKC